MKASAVVTIKGPGAMTPKARKAIAAWLRLQAVALETDGKDYTDVGLYRGRYLCAEPRR